MKILYLNVEGICKTENTRINARNLEMPDGPHPVTNDSVWQHDLRTYQPLMIIVQGILGPIGSSMASEDVKTILYEIKLASMAFKSPSISKMWQRALMRIMDFFMKYGILLFIGSITLWAVYNSLTGGA